MKTDPRVDTYIEKAAPFARPILKHVRARVHAVAPEVEETLKWSMPSFTVGGKILMGMAAFKAHAVVGFWRGGEMGVESSKDAMGHLGKLKSVEDLPPEDQFDSMILKGVELARSAPASRKTKHEPKPPPSLHPEFASALAAARKARKVLDGFPPSAQRESRLGRRGEAGLHPAEAHRRRHRMAERRQTPALEIRKLLNAVNGT